MATVKPLENFSSAQDAHLLRQEMKGFGTDEQAIVDILTARSNSQRVAIVKFFHSEMDRDLVEDLTCELGSNYEDLTAALLFAPVEYAIRQINQILDGFDEIDDLDLVEIICTRPADQIRTIAKRYRCQYGRHLADHLSSDASSNNRRLLSLIVNGVLEEQTVEQSIENEASKSAIVECVSKPVAFLANRLQKALNRSTGLKPKTVIRIIVSRCEIDLADIKEEFERIANRKLLKAVESEITGDYKKALCTLIGKA